MPDRMMENIFNYKGWIVQVLQGNIFYMSKISFNLRNSSFIISSETKPNSPVIIFFGTVIILSVLKTESFNRPVF